MRPPTYLHALLVILSLLAGGCAGPGLVPSRLAIGGTWVGTVKDSVVGETNIRVLLSQDYSAATRQYYSRLWGTWESDVSLPLNSTPSDPTSTRRGGLQGSVNASSASFTLSAGGSTATRCLLQVGAGVNLDQNQMAGTYTYVSDVGETGCRVSATGRVTLNKQ